MINWSIDEFYGIVDGVDSKELTSDDIEKILDEDNRCSNKNYDDDGNLIYIKNCSEEFWFIYDVDGYCYDFKMAIVMP